MINLIIALRNLRKNKVISVINILCLSIGLICAVFAIIFSHYELTYESCHKNANRICRVYTYGKFGNIRKMPNAFGPEANVLKSTFPEIELTSRSRSVNGTVFKGEEPISEDNIIFSDSALFSIFTFNFLKGERPTAPNSVILSEKMANKYFGSDDPVGKSIKISIHGHKKEYFIKGVFKDFPSNTQLKASFIIPFKQVYLMKLWQPDEYNSLDFAIYTLLAPGTDVKKLNAKIAHVIKIPANIKNVKCVLVPIKKIQLYENIGKDAMGNFLAILIGGIVALIISIFNYINSSTILFTTRLKEIGIKKTIGGSKSNIFIQFFTETFLSVGISFIFSLMMVQVLLPYFNAFMDTDITLTFNVTIASLVAGIFLFTVIVSSLYPAMKSLTINSISLIRNEINPGMNRNNVSNALIILQFIIAILLIQFNLITYKQIRHMSAQDVLKYNADNVICLGGHTWGDLNTLKQELLKNPAIQTVSWSEALPGIYINPTPDWKKKGNKEMANVFSCEKDYLNVFHIKMQEGRFFTNQSSDKNYAVINPLTAKSLGYDDPIGKTVELHGSQYIIIGETDDYFSVPPVIQQMPLIITRANKQSEYLVIRVQPQQRKAAQLYIKKVLHKVNPDYPVDIKYYENIGTEAGKSYEATLTFIRIFTGIIIFNAMMGLFALSFFMSVRKNKEIGVRKVCGAKVNEILWKLSYGFISKLFVAFIIATPLSYILGLGYISIFTTKTDLSPWIFAMGGIIAFVMLFISTGWKVIYTANRNPVETLRYE